MATLLIAFASRLLTIRKYPNWLLMFSGFESFI
jgi:hypothetical protein